MVKRHNSVEVLSVESVKPRSKTVAAVSGVVKALMFLGVLTVEVMVFWTVFNDESVNVWWKSLEVWQQGVFNVVVFLPLFSLFIFTCIWSVKLWGAYNAGKGFKKEADRQAVWVKRNSGVAVFASVLTICAIVSGLWVYAAVFVPKQAYYCINAKTMVMDYTTDCYQLRVTRMYR